MSYSNGGFDSLGEKTGKTNSNHNDISKYEENPGPTIEEKNTGEKVKKCLLSNILLILLVVSMAVGIGMGIGIRNSESFFEEDKYKRNLMYLKFPGDLLMRMLKMAILPLIVSSLIAGMAGLPTRSAGKLGGRAVLYYLITTFLAVLLGILLVSTIKPGEKGKIDDDIKGSSRPPKDAVDSLLDLIRNVFPNNLMTATFSKAVTEYKYETEIINATDLGPHKNETGTISETVIVDFNPTETGGTNILGIVVFCCVFGVIIGHMDELGRPVKDFFNSFQFAMIKLVTLIIWYAPIGIAFLLASRIVGMEDPEQAFKQLMWYMLTVLVGLAIHAFLVLPLIYFAFVRKNPVKLFFNMGQALLTALGTASSSATLPITLKCLIQRAKIDRRVGEFVLPVGATINMDGTALYEAVAAIFIAQYNNISLSAGQVVTISITATAAAIGAAGIPEGGLVTMAIVLDAVGLPVDDIALILAVDWFLDRFRTATNVWGDSVGAGVVESLSKEDLAKMDADDQLMNERLANDDEIDNDVEMQNERL